MGLGATQRRGQTVQEEKGLKMPLKEKQLGKADLCETDLHVKYHFNNWLNIYKVFYTTALLDC